MAPEGGLHDTASGAGSSHAVAVEAPLSDADGPGDHEQPETLHEGCPTGVDAGLPPRGGGSGATSRGTPGCLQVPQGTPNGHRLPSPPPAPNTPGADVAGTEPSSSVPSAPIGAICSSSGTCGGTAAGAGRKSTAAQAMHAGAAAAPTNRASPARRQLFGHAVPATADGNHRHAAATAAARGSRVMRLSSRTAGQSVASTGHSSSNLATQPGVNLPSDATEDSETPTALAATAEGGFGFGGPTSAAAAAALGGAGVDGAPIAHGDAEAMLAAIFQDLSSDEWELGSDSGGGSGSSSSSSSNESDSDGSDASGTSSSSSNSGSNNDDASSTTSEDEAEAERARQRLRARLHLRRHRRRLQDAGFDGSDGDIPAASRPAILTRRRPTAPAADPTEAGPGGFSFAGAWLELWLRYISREYGGARFFIQDPENLRQVLHLARPGATTTTTAAADALPTSDATTSSGGDTSAAAPSGAKLREQALTVVLTACREMASDRDFKAKFLDRLIDGGLCDTLCSHLSAAASAAGDPNTRLDTTACQLTAALIAIMADWSGWEAAVRKACGVWESWPSSSGGAGRDTSAAAAGASGSTRPPPLPGGDAQLPVLLGRLLDLSALLPTLILSKGAELDAVEAATAGPSGGGGGAADITKGTSSGSREDIKDLDRFVETFLMVSFALCRSMECGGRTMRAALRQGLQESGYRLDVTELDGAITSGRLDWLLLRTAAAPRCKGTRNGTGGGNPAAAATRDGLAALPTSALSALLRLLTPRGASYGGTHRWVNVAAASITGALVDAVQLAAPDTGGGRHKRNAVGRRLRRKLLGCFRAVDGFARLAELLDDCHDEADKAPTFQSRDSQRSQKRGVATNAIHISWRMLRWADAEDASSSGGAVTGSGSGSGSGSVAPVAAQGTSQGAAQSSADPDSPLFRVRGSRSAGFNGSGSGSGGGGADGTDFNDTAVGACLVARAALAYAGDQLSWVCVSSLESLTMDGAHVLGMAIGEICARAQETTAALSELDPCWRAVRVLGDDRTGPAAQMLGAHIVCAYPGVVRGKANNPYIDMSIITHAVRRQLRLAADAADTHMAATPARAALLLARCFRVPPSDICPLLTAPAPARSAAQGHDWTVAELVLDTHPQALLCLFQNYMTTASVAAVRWASAALAFLEDERLLGPCLLAAAREAPGLAGAAGARPTAVGGSRPETWLAAVAKAAAWRAAHAARASADDSAPTVAAAAGTAGPSTSGSSSSPLACAAGGRGAIVLPPGTAPYALAGLCLIAAAAVQPPPTTEGRPDLMSKLATEFFGPQGTGVGAFALPVPVPARGFGSGRRGAAAAALAAALAAFDASQQQSGAGTTATTAASTPLSAAAAPRHAFMSMLRAARALTSAAPLPPPSTTSKSPYPVLGSLSKVAELQIHHALESAATVAAGPPPGDTRRSGSARSSRRRAAAAAATAAAHAEAVATAVLTSTRWAEALAKVANGKMNVLSQHPSASASASCAAVASALSRFSLSRAAAASAGAPPPLRLCAGNGAVVTVPLDMARRCEALVAMVDIPSEDPSEREDGGTPPAVPLPPVGELSPLVVARLLRVVVTFDGLQTAYAAARAAMADAAGDTIDDSAHLATAQPAAGGTDRDGSSGTGDNNMTVGGSGASTGVGASGNTGGEAVVNARALARQMEIDSELLITAAEQEGFGNSGGRGGGSGRNGGAGGNPRKGNGGGGGNNTDGVATDLVISKDDLVDLWVLADFIGYAPLFAPVRWLLSRAVGTRDAAWVLMRLPGHPLAPDLISLYARALISAWRNAAASGRPMAWTAITECPVLERAVQLAAADVVAACAVPAGGGAP